MVTTTSTEVHRDAIELTEIARARVRAGDVVLLDGDALLSSALVKVARHIDAAEHAILHALEAHAHHRGVEGSAATPEEAGRAQAQADMADTRWVKALGARAALEALYQDLSGGVPSPNHEASTRALAESGLSPNPVGLDGAAL